MRGFYEKLDPSLTGKPPVPGQEIIELGGWVIVDAGEDIGEPSLRVDIVELRGLDERVDNGSALPTAT